MVFRLGPISCIATRCETRFIRGNCNGDGAVDISDAICVLTGLFLDAGSPGCAAAMNTNGDQAVDISEPSASTLDVELG